LSYDITALLGFDRCWNWFYPFSCDAYSQLFSKKKPQRTILKKIFTRLDLIGEGEVWFGGLVSLAIIVLIAFTCKFSMSFFDLYPIENTSSEKRVAVSCNPDLLNAKFTSNVQLLSVQKHDNEIQMIEILHQQNLTLMIDFVSTSFKCDNVRMYRDMSQGDKVRIFDYDCSENKSFILSVSVGLSQHRIKIETVLYEKYFVGGLRVCILGPYASYEHGKYILQSLNFCKFFFPPNDVLSFNTGMTIQMTKVINQTAGLTDNDNVSFGGLWLFKPTIMTLSDHLFYQQYGGYIRYETEKFTLLIDIIESEFYIKNTQEPIARAYEITFNTILFSTKIFRLKTHFLKSKLVKFERGTLYLFTLR
jgi:hypothetical protein